MQFEFEFEDRDVEPVLCSPSLEFLAAGNEVLVLFLRGWVAGYGGCAPLLCATDLGEMGELAIGEGEDEGAVVEDGGGGADVVAVGWWWHIRRMVFLKDGMGNVRMVGLDDGLGGRGASGLMSLWLG